MNHVYRNAPIYAALNKVGGYLVSGAYDSALPSNGWQSLGWALENRDTISSSIDSLSSKLSSFRDTYFNNDSYVDDGFRFYDQPSGDSNFSFGDWSFD